NVIRHGDRLIRCEACGVILAAAEPVEESTEAPADDEVITNEESEVDANEELSSEEVTDDIEEEASGVDGGDEEG
ncbi:MAG TPA: hypothetical protein DG084_04380, partial [Gemmatimonadetes bacterium]|nr:hypothetical protein [Gemmatimonadota bacterium]